VPNESQLLCIHVVLFCRQRDAPSAARLQGREPSGNKILPVRADEIQP
jgi:hypothetical protein